MGRNIKKDRQVLKTAEEMVEDFSSDYMEPTAPGVVAEVIEEIIVRLFYRIIKLNILAFATIQFIYMYIMKIAPKDRVYELLSIYKNLQLQKLFNAGLITKKQLVNMSINENNFKYQVENGAYHVNFDERFADSYTAPLLNEDIMWALFLIANYVDMNETAFCYVYNELKELDFSELDLDKEITNLIIRLRIREMRKEGFLTEDDEAIFMSKIQEYDLTYQFFDWEEINNWKSKAFHSLNLRRMKK